MLSAHALTVLISVLKLRLDEVRELSSGSKKFLKPTEFTLECSLNEKTREKKKGVQKSKNLSSSNSCDT